jgi:hypothetical protein
MQRRVIINRNEKPPAERAIIVGVVKKLDIEVCRSRRRSSRGIVGILVSGPIRSV